MLHTVDSRQFQPNQGGEEMTQEGSSLVKALEDKPLYMQAYEQIKVAILSGRIRPGARLSQVRLAEELRVSRAPVIDALARLATEGIVEHSPRSGYFVRTFTTKDVADIYNVRCALECQALEELYERVRPDEIESLAEILGDTYVTLQHGDMRPYVLADDAFHTKLVELAGNNVISTMLDQLKDQIQLIRVMVAVSPERVIRAAKEHEEILASLLDHDLQAGRQALRHHIDSVRVEVINQLQNKVRS